MKSLQLSTSAPTRLAATLAVVAGVLTGALWPVDHLARLDMRSAAHASANQVDPAIPALTIVAKKLSAAEKRQLARQEVVAAGDF